MEAYSKEIELYSLTNHKEKGNKGYHTKGNEKEHKMANLYMKFEAARILQTSPDLPRVRKL